MDEQEQTQSAELTRIEEALHFGHAQAPLVAVLKSHQSQINLLLGMVKKLTQAAQTETGCTCGFPPEHWMNTRWKGQWHETNCPMYQTPETPTTPQPACEHRNMALVGHFTPRGTFERQLVHRCLDCPAVLFQGFWRLPQTQAPPVERSGV